MKSSAVLASLLFGSFAVAAPVDKRALIYKTEVVVETVVVYTTVWDDEVVPEATTTPAGNFYEQPPQPSSPAAEPIPTSAAPAPEQKTSSVAPPQAPTPTPAPAPAPAPVPSPSPAPEQPKPVEEPKTSSPPYVAPASSSVAPAAAPAPSPAAPAVPAAPASSSVAPAPAASSAAPAPITPPPTGGPTSGEQHSNVDITIFDNEGGFGACGIKQYDTDMIAAISKGAWGASTYDVMTGKATNPWCGQKIKVEYEGKFVEVTITDMCPGCLNSHDIDLSLTAWKDLTGKDEKTRLKASWSKIA